MRLCPPFNDQSWWGFSFFCVKGFDLKFEESYFLNENTWLVVDECVCKY